MDDLPDKNVIENTLGRELTNEEQTLLFRLELRKQQAEDQFRADLKWNIRVLWAIAIISLIFLFAVLIFGAVIPMWLLFAHRWGALIATAVCVSCLILGFLIVFAITLGIRRGQNNI